MSKSVVGVTPIFTADFPNLFKPRSWKDPQTGVEGKPKYSVTALFEKGQDLSTIIALIEGAMTAEFGPDKTKWPKIPNPLRDQAERAKDQDGKKVLPQGYVEGAKFLMLDSTNKPVIVDGEKKDITDPAAIYSGIKGVAAVGAKYWKMEDRYGVKQGVKLYLNGFQKQADGEPLGGHSRPEALFQAVGKPATAGGAPASASSMFE